jgi:bifunctional oligoribonuclease and PAP phosphatase NrnA
LGLSLRNISYLYPLEKNIKVLDLAKYTKELSNHLSSANNILLICHVNPDGDAIGSQLALYHYLKSIGKNAEMLSPNFLQEFLKWMEGVEKINIFIKERKACRNIIDKADLIIMLDFNQPGRLGEAEDIVMRSGAKKIIIDHHLNSGSFGDLVISDTTKCSTSELIHEIICIMNGGIFSSNAYCNAIYVGIVTDTGNFEHGSYTGNTFRIIADLLDTGLERDKIFNLVFNNFSADRMRLQGFSISERMVVLPEYRTAYISLSKSDLAKYNYQKGDTEGFVNMPLSISGVDFSALFIEKDGFVKLSFRSKGSFSVNEFAEVHFSGGGHLNAAGGEYFDTLENTLNHFLKVLEKDSWKITGKS